MKAISSPTSTASAPSSTLTNAPLSACDVQPAGRVVFGPGGLNQLGALVRELGGTRVLLVTDPGLQAAGHPQRALACLRAAGVTPFVFDAVEENPETHHVTQGVSVAREQQIDFLVALGGGSSMDCAKGINFIYTNGGQMADYRGHGKATKPMLPSIGVPTTTGTGSEAQSYALITDESSHLKMACGDRKVAFRVAILDPELTITQPRMVTAVTGIDALAHAIESFVCTKRNAFSSMYAATAWQYLEPNFARTLTTPTDLAARAAMQLGAHYAGMAIEASMLGICHSCANPLTAHYGLTHGTAIGLLLPHVIRFNAPAAEGLYAQLVGGNGPSNGELASETLARRVTELVQLAGLPSQLRACGVSASILHLLAEEASQQWTAKFNPRPVSEADLLHIYQAAF